MTASRDGSGAPHPDAAGRPLPPGPLPTGALLSRRGLLARAAGLLGAAVLAAPACAPAPAAVPPAPTASPTPAATRDPTAPPRPTRLTVSPSARSAVRPTAAPPPPSPSPSPTAPGRIVLAYYVPYDSTSWASLEAHADQIDYVVTQTISVDLCAGLATQDDRTLLAFAQARGVRVLPSLFTFSQAINHRLLTDPATTARTVQTLVDYVAAEGYAGLDIDLEDIAPADRAAFTAFVGRLADALHARGKLLTMAVAPKARETTAGLAAAYDYAALGRHVDLMTVMTYDYSWAGGPPGAIAPYAWVDQVIGYATGQVPPHKVLLGVGFYGYDWNVTSGGRARALRYPQAAALAARYGTHIGFDPALGAATFAYIGHAGDPPVPDPRPPFPAHDIRHRAPPACTVPTPTPAPARGPSWTIAGQHVIWIEDARSFAGRLALADRHHTGGIGAWRLGQEDPAIWAAIAAWRRAPAVPTSAPRAG